MITKDDLPEKSDDAQNLKLALKEGCYYLACVWQEIQPVDSHIIYLNPKELSIFSEENPFVHLYRRFLNE